MPEQANISDQVILVTGGAVRVGRRICEELARRDAEVYCHYHRSGSEARALQREHHRIHPLQADLADPEAAVRLVDAVVKSAGRIDGLVNNASVFFPTTLGTVTREQWNSLMDINLRAPFQCAERAGLIMKRHGGGMIINIGDAAGENPWPSYIPYGLTKAAVIAMTRGLAKALAPEVRVNCINPGPVMLPEHYSESQQEQAIARTVLKQVGAPEDIARMVRYLFEEGGYITGAVIPVDGGRSIA